MACALMWRWFVWVGGWFVDVGWLHLCCISTATCMVYTCTLPWWVFSCAFL